MYNYFYQSHVLVIESRHSDDWRRTVGYSLVSLRLSCGGGARGGNAIRPQLGSSRNIMVVMLGKSGEQVVKHSVTARH
jgi:hypothetical protein